MSELKPCPFCGSKAELITQHRLLAYFVECANEQCSGSVQGDTEDEVVSAWNARPIEDALNARIAELEAESVRFTVRMTQDELKILTKQAKAAGCTRSDHSDIERQDDKSPNDTQAQTFVYRKEREE